jgi:hypothetical protein
LFRKGWCPARRSAVGNGRRRTARHRYYVTHFFWFFGFVVELCGVVRVCLLVWVCQIFLFVRPGRQIKAILGENKRIRCPKKRSRYKRKKKRKSRYKIKRIIWCVPSKCEIIIW